MKESVVKEKSKKFALRIVKLYQFLCNERSEYVLSKQVLRSGTSIGANIAEAVYAQSEADFISKLSIARKEANETVYWIELLHDAAYLDDKLAESMLSECKELIRLLSSTIKTLKSKNANS